MQAAGYILAGGASSRMGRNKAFLVLDGRSMLEIAISAVLEAVGNATIVGPPEIYAPLGLPVIPDRIYKAGPLAGIESALRHTERDWNLIVACDMPRLAAGGLRRILAEGAAHPEAACILPVSESATGDSLAEPLCAAYHRRLLPAITDALEKGIRKVTAALPPQSVHYLRMTPGPDFQNVNTPEEWRLVSDPN